MKAIAIDDEPIALEVIKAHGAKVPFLELSATYTDAFKAIEHLHRETMDLIFLDIKMPDISGIEFMNSLSKKPLVIFTTAYAEHAVTSFELDAVDYLLKPFSFARFFKGCNKAFELHRFRSGTTATDHFFIKTGYEQVKVAYNELLYLEATGNYVTYVLQDKHILSRCTFNEAISQLPGDKFLRVHRSYVVSTAKLDKIERHQVTINKHKVPVGDAYLQNLAVLLKK